MKHSLRHLRNMGKCLDKVVSIVVLGALPYCLSAGTGVSGPVAKDILLGIHKRVTDAEQRISSLENQYGHMLPYSAEAQIECLKGRNDWLMTLLGGLSVVVTLLAGWKISEAIVAMKTAKVQLIKAQEKANSAAEKAEEAYNNAVEVNVKHQAYNSRLYHSLARQCELLSDKLWTAHGVSAQIDAVIDPIRASTLQTAFLYYDEALKYCVETKDGNGAYVDVNSLANLYKLLKRRNQLSDIGMLKQHLLKTYRWNYSKEYLDAIVRMSNKNVKEIDIALTGYGNLIAAVGGTPRVK